MNRKLLVIFVGLMVVALSVIPVLAAPNADAWRTVPAALVYNESVKYDKLTDYCLNVWGLSENPYPNYPASANPAYYVFKLQIGDDVYEGVSVNTQTWSYSPATGLSGTAQAIWYLGDWGKDNARMNQGFAGTVILQLPDYNPTTKKYTYFLGWFDMDGFQRFNHQSLSLYGDSRISPLSSGTCTALGNRDKN